VFAALRSDQYFNNIMATTSYFLP